MENGTYTTTTFNAVEDIIGGNLTALKPVWTNASKVLISQDINLCNVVQTHISATTQNVVTGTLTSGTVSDTQTWGDGNIVNVTEVTGVPGFDVQYVIANVASFCAVGISTYYNGSAAHICEIQIYDDTNTTWRTLFSLPGTALSLDYRYSNFPDQANMTDYINANNEVLIRVYHITGGNASQELYIDYVSIIGVSV